MSAMHAYIGFLNDWNRLDSVDSELQPIATVSYKIPGFGSHGVSCAGHLNEYDDEIRKDRKLFYPQLDGHLGFACLPQLPHMPELLTLLYAHARTDSDAWLEVEQFNLAFTRNIKDIKKNQKYVSGMKLHPYAVMQTASGLDVVQLKVRIGDNRVLARLKDYYGGYLDKNVYSRLHEKSKERIAQIQLFWEELAGKIENYNKAHGFYEVNFDKSEFLPFR